jgi:hypothetical protein
LAGARFKSRPWVVAATASVALLLAGASLVGLWVYPPRWTLFAFGVALSAAAVHAWRRAGEPGRSGVVRTTLNAAGVLAWAALGGVLLWQGVAGRIRPSGEMFDLAAPLEGEGFCVISGGASPLMNFHMATLAPGLESSRGQSYGVDFIRLSPLDLRTVDAAWWRPRPRPPEDYRVFGAEVRAPCTGDVAAAVDGQPDQAAGDLDRSHMAGNHLVLHCEGYDVLLAHLRQGSVRPSVGQHVSAGDPVGEVGNTGNTDEPHLHLSVQRPTTDGALGGEPVHVMFGGRFLTRHDCL